jgi:hypothetical protein
MKVTADRNSAKPAAKRLAAKPAAKKSAAKPAAKAAVKPGAKLGTAAAILRDARAKIDRKYVDRVVEAMGRK